ncbi:MAG: PASTA domain-containing protein [Bacteroidota bacterium]
MRFDRTLFKLLMLHLSLIMIVLTGIIFLFFELGLPIITRHNHCIIVPSLKGRSLTEAAAYLKQRGLYFEISSEFFYNPQYAPETILQQHPRAGTKVKAGRKIFLILNTTTPPEVAMPNLIDSSVRNANILLQSQGLLLGEITYVPDIAQNAVLEQWYQGTPIPVGTPIAKSAMIDLVVGAGLSNETITIPDVAGMPHKEAELALLSAGVGIGSVTYEASDVQPAGTVLRQIPATEATARIGETVDLWLVALPEEEASTTEPVIERMDSSTTDSAPR